MGRTVKHEKKQSESKEIKKDSRGNTVKSEKRTSTDTKYYQGTDGKGRPAIEAPNQSLSRRC